MTAERDALTEACAMWKSQASAPRKAGEWSDLSFAVGDDVQTVQVFAMIVQGCLHLRVTSKTDCGVAVQLHED